MNNIKHDLQLFVNNWCLKLKVPFVRIKFVNQEEIDKEDNTDTEDVIYLLDQILSDKEYCYRVLLHEMVHLALYYNLPKPIYKDEQTVDRIADILYKNYCEEICSKK